VDRKTEDIALDLLRANVLKIRDIDAGEKPFIYTSGNWGPGYVNIKKLVSAKKLMLSLTKHLAEKIAKYVSQINFIAGSATGGMIPGWLVAEHLETILGKAMPYVYIRKAKRGERENSIIGIEDNPEIQKGDKAILVEELINFGQTTCINTKLLREAGYTVTHIACILFYDNPQAVKSLQENRLEIIYLITLPQLLGVAEKHNIYPPKVIDNYREFLKNPLEWQIRYGLQPIFNK